MTAEKLSAGGISLSELSQTMKKAVEFAKQHGNVLIRHPGGFWSHENWHINIGDPAYGTGTIEGIVKRGAGEYTEWKDGRRGRFPIRMTLTCAQGWD